MARDPRTALAALLSLLGCLSSATARADADAEASGAGDEQPPPPAYTLDLSIDLPVLAGSTVLALGWGLRHQLEPAHCAPLCDRDDLFWPDRAVAGRWSPSWSRASDVAVGLNLVGGLTAHFAAESSTKNGLSDLVVVGESVMVTAATQLVVATAVRRPRPFVYGDEAPEDRRTDGHAALSFFSGHTANAFAITATTYSTLRYLRPGSRWSKLYLGAGLACALFVGTGRALAGHHFPTDVAAGAVIGTSVGFLVPRLHRTRYRLMPTAPSGGAGLALVGAF